MQYLSKIASVVPLLALAAISVAQTNFGHQAIPAEEINSLDKPTIIDTRKFEKPIVTTYTHKERAVNNQFKTNPFKGTEAGPNQLPLGGLLETPRRPNYSLWPAITATGWIPPDPTLGVGPSHVVVTVNSSLAFFTRTGTKQFEQTFNTFLGLPGATFTFDPKVFYDRLSQRFFMVILEQSTSPEVSKLHIMVSDDSDPNGTWTKYVIDARRTISGVNHWLDYPGFGYNNDAIVLTGNMFSFAGNVFGGVQFHVLPKAPLLSGGAATEFRLFDSNMFSMQMAETTDAGVAQLNGVSTFNTSFVRACSITNVTTAPVLNTWFVPVPTFVYPTNYATSPSGRFLHPSDGRQLNASWRDGRLLSSHAIRTASDSTNLVRWYEFDFSATPGSAPTLVQSGNVAAASGTHYFMPAINKNANGDISLLFSRSSTSIVADLMFAGRYSTDAAGFMGSPVLLKSSEGATYDAGNRWGDYFQIEVDPIDDDRFWGIGMVGDSAGNWRTHVYDWTLSKLSSVGVSPTAVVGGTGTTVTYTVNLGTPAGPSGATVHLSTDNAAASMPATLTIPSGLSSGSVTVTHSQVTSAQSVLLIATLGDSSMSTTLTVNPVPVQSLSINPIQQNGGKLPHPIGTVTLANPAPAGGTVVSLSSSHTSHATVPSTVTVAAGTTSKTFTVTTIPNDTTRTVTITATNGNSATATVKVIAPKISRIAFQPTAVTGGLPNMRNATVYLTGPAPAGGAVVALTTTSPLITLTSSSVTVPAGAKSAAFTYQALTSVAAETVEQVTATYKGTATGNVRITPPKLHSFGVSQTSVVGGSATVVKVTIRLTAPAPVGGMTVSLSSSNPAAAALPATATLPAGTKTLQVKVIHSAVGSNTNVTLTATLNGQNKAKVLTVTP